MSVCIVTALTVVISSSMGLITPSRAWSNEAQLEILGRGNRTKYAHDALGRRSLAISYNPEATFASSAAERTVSSTVNYDDFGQPSLTRVTVGSRTSRSSMFELGEAGTSAWRRRLDIDLGNARGKLTYAMDAAGRLASISRGEFKNDQTDPWTNYDTTFSYAGHVRVGRTQDQEQRLSKFSEKIALDPYGLPRTVEYFGIEASANGTAKHPSEQTAYCPLGVCSRPLWWYVLVRDKRSRVASVKSESGEPLVAAPRHTWRGYAYSPLQHLSRVWEADDATTSVNQESLTYGDVDEADIAAVGAGRTQWHIERETSVGSVLSVTDVTALTMGERFRATRSGHLLSTAVLEPATPLSTARSVAHDSDLRVTAVGSDSYTHDGMGRLVTSVTGSVSEGYLYDGFGRMAARYEGGSLVDEFVYDGDQMVASIGPTQAMKWHAVWGPGQDNLIEFRAADTVIPLVDHRNSVSQVWSETGSSTPRAKRNYSFEGRYSYYSDDEAVDGCDEEKNGSTICADPAGLPFGFNSAWKSDKSGLIYMRNRWYSPRLGEFLSRHPLGPVDSFNLHAFAGFDPINFWDPFGLKRELGAGKGVDRKKKQQEPQPRPLRVGVELPPGYADYVEDQRAKAERDEVRYGPKANDTLEELTRRGQQPGRTDKQALCAEAGIGCNTNEYKDPTTPSEVGRQATEAIAMHAGGASFNAGEAVGAAVVAGGRREATSAAKAVDDAAKGAGSAKIPWSNKTVKLADESLSQGATSVRVGSRSEAEELFLGRYQGEGYRNASGFSPKQSKDFFGQKGGTYHWDTGSKAYPHDASHLQIHTHEGPIIRIYFPD